MRDTNLPELGFHLGSGVTAGEEGWRNLRGKKKKNQVIGNSPLPFIYLQIV